MIGREIHAFAESIWGFNRSITGNGVRETLNSIKSIIPELKIRSVPSGTLAFDWIVPKEWKVSKAYIITPEGKKICDFQKHNLHLVGYSVPFSGIISLTELQDHLYSIPEQPDAIPYITSYYKERWGFCISHNDRLSLIDGNYHVVVDTELFDGFMNYGELVIPGKSPNEVFLSTYICHPSMANNELSGPCVLTFIARHLLTSAKSNYTYRIIFIPETIGSIVYLSKNLSKMKKRVFAGFNLTCIGDNRSYSYLPSKSGLTYSDRVAVHVLRFTDPNFVSYDWTDRGSDERQYCAPGVDLPVASLMRTKYGAYPEYHTSLDDLKKVVTPEGLQGGYLLVLKVLQAIEANACYKSKILCEPNMGKRGLYPTILQNKKGADVSRMMNVLSYCDGSFDLIEIAEILKTPIWKLYDTINTLLEHELIALNCNDKSK